MSTKRTLIIGLIVASLAGLPSGAAAAPFVQSGHSQTKKASPVCVKCILGGLAKDGAKGTGKTVTAATLRAEAEATAKAEAEAAMKETTVRVSKLAHKFYLPPRVPHRIIYDVDHGQTPRAAVTDALSLRPNATSHDLPASNRKALVNAATAYARAQKRLSEPTKFTCNALACWPSESESGPLSHLGLREGSATSRRDR